MCAYFYVTSWQVYYMHFIYVWYLYLIVYLVLVVLVYFSRNKVLFLNLFVFFLIKLIDRYRYIHRYLHGMTVATGDGLSFFHGRFCFWTVVYLTSGTVQLICRANINTSTVSYAGLFSILYLKYFMYLCVYLNCYRNSTGWSLEWFTIIMTRRLGKGIALAFWHSAQCSLC